MSFTLYILTAIALILVIEGLIYAVFPETIRRMFEMALSLPPARLRLYGLFMAGFGSALVWLLQSFSNG